MSDWAVILGASSGFGGATAKELAKVGVNICGVHLDKKSTLHFSEEVIGEIENAGQEALFFNMNAADAEKRAGVVAQLKAKEARVKILMHSLAFGALKPVFPDDPADALTQAQVEMTLDVMANSVVYWAQDLYQAGLLQKGGQIFAMTSSGGHRQWTSYGAVSAAKAALESFMRQLAYELAPKGIAANTIQAGITDTAALRKIPGNLEMIENGLRTNPSGRLTQPEDIAKVIARIGLSEETWMSGNVIRVDGTEDLVG